MKTEHNDWKVLPLFIVAVTAAILSSAFSKVKSAQAWAISEPTIEERLLKVREQLQQKNKFHLASSPQNKQKTQENKTLLSQFPVPWQDTPPWPPYPRFNEKKSYE